MALNLKSASFENNALPLTLAVAVGAFMSPAFTFGAFVKSRLSAAVALLLFVGWSFLQWRIFWVDYGVYPEAGTIFVALFNRTIDQAESVALTRVLGVNVAWLLAGVVARYLFENYRYAIVPLSMAASAFALVIVAQTHLSKVEARYYSVAGIEVGKQQAITASRKISDAVVEKVALTDREKLVVNYAQLIAAKSGYGVDATEGFEEYVERMARSCEGQEEVPVCDNRLLQKTRSKQASLGL